MRFTLLAACIIGLKGLLSVVELDEEGMRLVCLGRVRRGRGGEFCLILKRPCA